MKIVGIGLNKTGTKTLGACFRHWGLKHQSFNEEAFELWRRKEVEELLKWVGEYESFEDWPWPLIYADIDRKYPEAKFILTKRKNPETWFHSLCKHADRTGPTIFRKYIYGHELPHHHKAEHIQLYEHHIESVRKYFQHRPDDFLEVCWENGDGWQELARFLGYEAPCIPFPHENKAPNKR
jgi:hypothetical protein